MIYFAQSGEDGPIKIGFTQDPAQRLKSLQTAHFQPLRLYALFPGSVEDEAVWHATFASCRLRGEWFEAGPVIALLDVIHRMIFGTTLQAVPLRSIDWMSPVAHDGLAKEEFWAMVHLLSPFQFREQKAA